MSTTGQVVDTATAQEFIAQALEKAQRAELGDIVGELEQKSARFLALLAPQSLTGLERPQLRGILRSIFATRRKADAIIDVMSVEGLRNSFDFLLYGAAPTQERFQGFVDCLSGYWGDVRLARKPLPGHDDADLPENILCDLASELLHFTSPDDRWLWTRWMWDPRVGTGAVPLVVEDQYDLHGRDAGETYMKVGVAVAFVRATGEAAGFAKFGVNSSPFGIDVFLSCVYAVYMYTTLRLRMTQEFNKVVPQLPELSRRLLGVWKMEL
ncbi:MAG: hypothetical protein HY023_18435 [Chloroflexi bacterium]|nr:hypothetical protein [Chloroflexota bacterium]